MSFLTVIYYRQSLDIFQAALSLELSVSLIESGMLSSAPGSSPNWPLVASFNAWSRAVRFFFLSTHFSKDNMEHIINRYLQATAEMESN